MTFFLPRPIHLVNIQFILLNGLLAQSEHVKQWLLNETTILSTLPWSAPSHRAGREPGFPVREARALTRNAKDYSR